MYMIAMVFMVWWIITPFIVSIIISSLLMRKGAASAGVKNPTFTRAFWTSVATSLVVSILAYAASFLLRVVPISGLILAPGMTSSGAREVSSMVWGGLLGGLITLAIIKWIYKTEWGKAAKVWLYFGIAQIIILTVGFFLWMRAYPDINWISG